MNKKYIYLFSEGNASMKNLLGGKGANLAEMTNLSLPVPQGFTITTEACIKYYEDGKKISDDIVKDIYEHMEILEKINNKKFGDRRNPLLVSVRSGARVSMPGMMDTILNLGLNDDTVQGLKEATNNERFAFDSYRRFIQMFSDVVMGIEKNKFEAILEEVKNINGAKYDTDLNAENLKEIVKKFKELYMKEMGNDFPQNPKIQLLEAVKAVFRSWDNPRAIVYRRLNDIPGNWGTAVNVQTMVFGNMGDDSGTGVAFTRNPATGEKALFGEYLMNAQGEDVVAGIRTPQPISTLKDIMPDIYSQFVDIANKLENHYKDMQDIEFTIEKGKLYILQTRNGKRTAHAAINVAVDLVSEGLIDEEEAVMRVEPKQLDQLLHPTFDASVLKTVEPVTKGLAASPGAASGKVYFTAEDAVKAAKEKEEKVVLVRLETSPEDIEGMIVAEGILTGRGGMTSHAAVVARGMGRCCVAGCSEAKINEIEKIMRIGDITIKEGDYISIDGSTGNVYLGKIKTVSPSLTGNFATLMRWSDKFRKLKVKANADIPRDAEIAVSFGAEGIGLCRTEHMFFAEDRISAIREMIISKTEEQRRKALTKLLPMQRSDFEGLFEAMGNYPVTIRLLDPPLHEFLPHEDEDIRALAAEMDIAFDDLKTTIESLKEFNPMLGHRGCRLAVTYPEIAEMQTKAIIEAAINVKNRTKYNIEPQIMIPLVGEIKELKYVKDIIKRTADKTIKENNANLKYLIGTMIEIPRAALTADEIAEEAEFFSFGTNDLTQMTFGFSRDDANKFLEAYYNRKIYEFDPFAKIDRKGVGKLIEMATKLGRQTKPDLNIGICGEHGGDPSSIEFCYKAGLDYVSCSPYRVPIARLAAAQAAIKNE
jgi:pyruvate,orthophosphate dikinase